MKPGYFLIMSIVILSLSALPTVVVAERTIIDQLGRQVNVPDSPQRIVSLAPNITEIIFALKQEHRLIGGTTFSDYPS